jgi:hypothetical protein
MCDQQYMSDGSEVSLPEGSPDTAVLYRGFTFDFFDIEQTPNPAASKQLSRKAENFCINK